MKVILNIYTTSKQTESMKKYFIIAVLAFITVSCINVDEQPPLQSGSMDKTFKLPDPKPMTASQREEYNARNKEYRDNVN